MAKRTFSSLLLSLSCLLFTALPALAQEVAATPSAPMMTKNTFLYQTVMYVLMGFFAFYFLVTKPSVQKEEEKKTFLANVKKNDEVLVAGGIFGRVHTIALEFISVEIAPNVRIRVKPDQLSNPVGMKSEGTKAAAIEDAKKETKA